VFASGPARPRNQALAGLDIRLLWLIAALIFVRVLEIVPAALADVSFDMRGTLRSFLLSYALLCPTALLIYLGVVAAANRAPENGWSRILALAIAVAVSSGVCVFARMELEVLFADRNPQHILFSLSYLWPRYGLLAALLTIARELYRRELATLDAASRAGREQARAEADATEARLQALQARIEPHFLFNTLANLRQLYEQDRAAGHQMLCSLVDYLQQVLPENRGSESTLQREAALVLAYLDIHRIRMGTRLSSKVEVPQCLAQHPIPPMLLLTLVENAIKHGLNPLPEGGSVTVTVFPRGADLVVSVADTGVGFRSSAGSGSGLANVRARLDAKYGARARLHLENDTAGGARVSILLPLVVA
jgi:hypothetical protein